MKFQQVAEIVDGIPWMTLDEARRMTDLVMEHKPRQVLELGFKHGTSSCYIAAALQEIGGGHLTTVDLRSALALDPNADTLLERCGLQDYATVFYEETSYTWRLMEMLERDPRPKFDLCYIDGAHNWDTDGFAFFLVDKLLAENAIIVLDDIEWSYEKSPTLQDQDWVKAMPRCQYQMQQIRKVFQLLVAEHPDYTDFSINNGWGFARKKQVNELVPVRVVEQLVTVSEQVGMGAALLRVARAAKKRLNGTLQAP